MINIIYGSSTISEETKLYTLVFDQKIKYNFTNESFDEILSLLNQTSLFELEDSADDIVVINNAKFLTDDKKNSKEFTMSLISCNQQIFCLVNAKSLKSFNEVVCKHKSKFNFIKATSFGNEEKVLFVNKLLKNHKLNFDTEKTKLLFIDELANNPYLIYNEVIKLENYSLSNVINEKVLVELVFNQEDEQIFNMIQYILLKKYDLALKLYNQLLKKKVQTSVIIATISSQLVDLKIQKKLFLSSPFINVYHLSEMTKIPYFILNKNYALLRNIKLSYINKLLDKLLLIDYNIKCSKSLPELEFKLFILEE